MQNPHVSHRALPEVWGSGGEAQPVQSGAGRGDVADFQVGRRTDGDGAGDGLDAEHVAGSAVVRRAVQVEAATWPTVNA